MKKHMRGLILTGCLACAFLVMPGCGSKEDSGAYSAAVNAYESGDYETAFSEFENAAKNDGRTAEAYRGMGLVYFEQGNYEFAVKMFDLSLSEMKHKNKEFEDDVLLYKAEALVNDGQTDEALGIYDSLKEGSDSAEAYTLEGCIYLRQGDVETAEEDFATAMEDKQDIALCLTIYEAYRDINLEGDGAEYLETAAAIEPVSAEDYALLGKVYDYLNEYDKACSSLNQAINMGYDKAAGILADIYFENGDISSAKSLFMNMVSSNRNTAMGYNGLALCAIEEGNFENAVEYIDLGLKCEDPDAEKILLFNEVVAYEKMLDFETAEEKAAAYLERYPSDKEMEKEMRFLSHS